MYHLTNHLECKLNVIASTANTAMKFGYCDGNIILNDHGNEPSSLVIVSTICALTLEAFICSAASEVATTSTMHYSRFSDVISDIILFVS